MPKPPFLGRLSIRARLFGAFGAIVAMTVCLGIVGLQQTGVVRRAAVDMETNWLPSVHWLSQMVMEASNHRYNVAAHILNTDATEMRHIEQRMVTWERAVLAARANYEPQATGPEELRLFPELVRSWDAYMRDVGQVVGLSRGGERERAHDLMEQRATPAFRAFRDAVDRLLKINIDGAAEAGQVARESYDHARMLVIGLLAAAALLGVALAWLIVRGIDRGIGGVLGAMRGLSGGDLSMVIPSRGEHTELGALADGVQAFKESLIEKRRADEAAAAEAAAKAARAERVETLVRGFETETSATLRAVAAATADLNGTARELATTAAMGAEQAGSVAAAAEQASVNVQTVAASAEEMTASIAEVARQVTNSAGVARRAAEDAHATNTTVASLTDAAGRIGEVVRVIADIAGQTNLLALNATIEAARAGEHGRGFAVVATEVKELAAQTARATEQIGGQIAAMQAETTRAVEAIRGIGRTVDEINDLTAQVAAAAEEQAAATREIGRAVAEAAAGTQDASRNAAGLAGGAQQTGDAAAQVRSAAGGLAQQAEGLRGGMDAFLAGLRAA